MHPRRFARRGSGYLLVVSAAMLVSVIGLTSLLLARVQQRSEDAAMDASRARLYARAGTETVLAYTRADATWRSQYATLVGYMPMSFDRGNCSVAITEADGNTLISDWDEPVKITSTGTVGSAGSPLAQQRTSVAAYHPALPLFRTALHAAGYVFVNGASLEVNDGAISTNSTFYNSGRVDGDVETRTLNNWGIITGTVTTSTTAKQMPSTSVFDYYANYATKVTLPASSVGSIMEWVLLSPAVNPYNAGLPSSDGLYYVRPTGDLRIRHTRVVGTLLVDMAANKTLTLEGGLLWEPARPDFPALIVRGACEISFTSTLYENLRTNFNPSSTPYQGSSDSDRFDSYSSSMRGLIHVVGSGSTLLLEDATTVTGTIISEGPVTIQDTVELTADPSLFISPPLKYRCTYLQVQPGSWQP